MWTFIIKAYAFRFHASRNILYEGCWCSCLTDLYRTRAAQSWQCHAMPPTVRINFINIVSAVISISTSLMHCVFNNLNFECGRLSRMHSYLSWWPIKDRLAIQYWLYTSMFIDNIRNILKNIPHFSTIFYVIKC